MRGRTPSVVFAPLSLLALLLVGCGFVDSTKTADEGTITAGEEASFTITVTASPEEQFCGFISQSDRGQVATFGVIGECDAFAMINDPLPSGIDWDFEILLNEGSITNVCTIAPGPPETLNCQISGLDAVVGTAADLGQFIVRVFGQTDPNDCPRTLTNTATVTSGVSPIGPEVEMPTDTIEVVCPAGTVIIEPPDIDPIGDIDPDIDISATPSIVFPTPDPDADDGEGPSVGTGDSGLSDGDGGFSLGWIAILSGLAFGGVAAAFGAIRFARR